MNYQEAFFKVVNEYGIEILKDRFFTRSLIADYIGGSLDDNQLLNAYCLLDKNQSVYEIIQNSSVKDSKEHLKLLISNQNKKYTARQYIKSIEPIYLLIYPKEYTPLKDARNNVKVKASLQRHSKKTNLEDSTIVNQHQNNVFKTINLNIPFCSFEVVFAKCKKLTITKDNRDVTLKTKPVFNQNAVCIDIKESRATYKLEVPMKQYDSINILQDGGYLTINSNDSSKFIARKMNITMRDGSLYIKASAKKINVAKDRGNVLQSGRYFEFSLSGKRVETYSFCYEDAPKRVNMALASGSIDLYFNNVSPKPKINRLFRKVTNVDGVYRLGSRTIKLNLSIKNGKIKVH